MSDKVERPRGPVDSPTPTDPTFGRMRALARRFDRMATECGVAQRDTSEEDLKPFFEGQRQAYAMAAFHVRETLAAASGGSGEHHG